MRVASDAEGRLVGQSSLPVGSEATSRQCRGGEELPDAWASECCI